MKQGRYTSNGIPRSLIHKSQVKAAGDFNICLNSQSTTLGLQTQCAVAVKPEIYALSWRNIPSGVERLERAVFSDYSISEVRCVHF